MSNFKICQEIVCIKSHSMGLFKKGDEFVIQGIKIEKCCGLVTLDIGLNINNSLYSNCVCVCGNECATDDYYASFLFAPKQELSETTYNEVLEWVSKGNKVEQLN